MDAKDSGRAPVRGDVSSVRKKAEDGLPNSRNLCEHLCGFRAQPAVTAVASAFDVEEKQQRAPPALVVIEVTAPPGERQYGKQFTPDVRVTVLEQCSELKVLGIQEAARASSHSRNEP